MSEASINITSKLDVMEESILRYDKILLQMLLRDKTTKRNIVWATKDYEYLGEDYSENCEILPKLVTGEHTYLIQPRAAKPKDEQYARTRNKAEVFTPCWVCNNQNNLVDSEWFGRSEVFNREVNEGWITNEEKITFFDDSKGWKKYVDAQRLEISCGEAPYLVSRYDTVTGEYILPKNRIGLYDRKMRVVEENASLEEWVMWSLRALQSVYGYEYQGDNLLLARENLLLSYIDYYKEHFKEDPGIKLLRAVANIISWNIWQMDGLKYVVPNSCHDIEGEVSLLGDVGPSRPCPGCKTNDIFCHNGKYCVIRDWRSKESVRFLDMMKGWN